MIRAVMEFFRDWGRLVTWFIFKPWNLRDQPERLAFVDEASLRIQDISYRYSVKSWRFLLQAFFTTVFVATAFNVLVAFLLSFYNDSFKWRNSLTLSMVGVISGFVSGLFAKGPLNDRNRCIRGGIVGGAWLGYLGGDIGLLLIPIISLLSGLIAVFEFSISLVRSRSLAVPSSPKTLLDIVGLVWISFLAPIVPIVFIDSTSLFPYCLIGSVVASQLSFIQQSWQLPTILPYYPFKLFEAFIAFRQAKHNAFFQSELVRTSIYANAWSELPEPFLSVLLLCVSRKRLSAGLLCMGDYRLLLSQQWAVQKTLRTLLDEDEIPFFLLLHTLLSLRQSNNSLHVNSLLLNLTPSTQSSKTATTSLILKFADRITNGLRIQGASPYSLLALYYGALFAITDNESESFQLSEEYLKYLTQLEVVLENSCVLPYGEEFYQSLRLAIGGLSKERLQQISEFRDEFALLFSIFERVPPLRPQIVSIFHRLRDAAQDASAFLTGEHELTRRDALLKAGGALEEARQLANEVYEPERSLLLAVIEHWRRMFAIEGGRVAEQREVEVLPNPYVAGRPIRPEDGRLFVGRKDEFRSIEEKLQSGVGIVIWGQRRIGKTSMLLHLPGHLSHDLLPVYLNLQMLIANSTGAFLYAVAREIVKQMRGVQSSGFSLSGSSSGTMPPEGGTLNAVSAEEFERQPYLSFNYLLEQIEERLQPGQRVLLSFDEFEELEQRVKDGKIEKEIFAYLRGVTQTGRGFALLFAGLHTLEQMTREYWNPFFASVQTLKVSYLSELDAEQLITDPVEQFPLSYEYEAIKRITSLTRSHAYLTQSLCHNLVNRLNDPLHRSQKAKREDVDAVIEKTLESSGYYFDDFVWGWSKENERIALSLLAEVEGEAAFAIVEKHLGREAALEATRKLVGRDILSERTGETGELVFRFQIPLAQMWVRRMKPSARILMEGGKL